MKLIATPHHTGMEEEGYRAALHALACSSSRWNGTGSAADRRPARLRESSARPAKKDTVRDQKSKFLAYIQTFSFCVIFSHLAS